MGKNRMGKNRYNNEGVIGLTSFKGLVTWIARPYFELPSGKKAFVLSFFFIYCVALSFSLSGSMNWTSLLISFLLSLFFSILITRILISIKSRGDANGLAISKMKLLLYSIPSLVIWLFYLLAFYPGVMTADSLDQWGQIQNQHFNDWHPVVHTWFMLLITKLWNSPAAIALIQIIILSLIAGYSAYTLEKYGMKRRYIYLYLLIISLVPVNGIYSVTLWKDILFSGMIWLITVVLFNVLISNGKWLDSWVNVLLFFIAGFGVALFRHNGLPVFIASIVIIAVVMRKKLIRIYLVSFVIIVMAFVIKGPIYDYYDVIPSDPNEALAIPTQQIAAIMARNGEMTKEQTDFFSKIMPISTWKESYNPYIVNPIKFNPVFLENKQYLLDHRKDFFRHWFKMVVDNPGIAVTSYFKETSLAWQIVPYADGYTYAYSTQIDSNEHAEKMGLKSSPKSVGLNELLTRILEISNKKPVSILMWRPALYFWVIILLCFILIMKKNWEISLVALPVLLNVGVVSVALPAQDFRYLYANMLVAMFLFFATFIAKEKISKI